MRKPPPPGSAGSGQSLVKSALVAAGVLGWQLQISEPTGRCRAQDDLQHRLSTWEPWADVRGGYLDIVQRNKLWRLLSGDDDFSVHHWLTRVENVPASVSPNMACPLAT